MILQLVTLSGVLFTSYKSWQKKNNKNFVHKLEYQSKELQRRPIKNKQQITRNIKSVAFAIPLSIAGMFYLPLGYLSIPFILYSEKYYFTESWISLKQREINVDTLIALAVTGAIVSGAFFIASLFAMIARISEYFTLRVIDESHTQLVDFFQNIPDKVWLLKNGVETHTLISDIITGDVLVINAGEVIPVDGHILSGMASIDEHQLTGEAILKEKAKGDSVYAMTLVLSGKIHVQVDKTGADSSAAKITDILHHITDYKSTTELRVETFSSQLVPSALISSAAAFVIFNFSSAVAALFVHPRNRLSISAPISLLKHISNAAEQDILIKDGRLLELLYSVDTIVFDKIGTLTEEKMHVETIHSFSNHTNMDVLRLAAIAEHKQIHPLAKVISDEAESYGLAIPIPEHSECRLGYGVKATYGEYTIWVGSRRFIEEENISIIEKAYDAQKKIENDGRGLIIVAVNHQIIGAIEFAPSIRAETRHVVQQLKQYKNIKKVCIISGDTENPTRHLAEKLGIEHYFFQVLPEQKAEIIKGLQQEGAFVCFVGDGINDAIAMKQAQVSVSLKGASPLAIDTAQIILLDKGIKHLPQLFEMACQFNHHVDQQVNIILASSFIGITGVFLGGWGMQLVMILNIMSLLITVGHALLEKPKNITPNLTSTHEPL